MYKVKHLKTSGKYKKGDIIEVDNGNYSDRMMRAGVFEKYEEPAKPVKPALTPEEIAAKKEAAAKKKAEKAAKEAALTPEEKAVIAKKKEAAAVKRKIAAKKKK